MSKVQVAGNASGTGIFTIASPNSNTDRTLTLPDATGTLATTGQAVTAAQMPVGSIIQVVQVAVNTNVVTTSTSFVSTGFTLTITPRSASNKILIMVNGGKCYTVSGLNVCRMYRNGTDVFGTNAQWTPFEGAGGSNHSFAYLDSPATTSATTYTPYLRSTTGAATYFADAPTTWGVVYITAMEVVA